MLRFERRALFYVLYVLAVLGTLWVGLVLFGESQDWGEDPGRWAGLPTFYWSLLAILLLGIFIIYALAVLVIRERPGRVYRIEGTNEPEPTSTPSFLQPAPEAAPTGETQAPPPGQP